MKSLVKNWKTTLTSLLVIVLLGLYNTSAISRDQLVQSTLFLVAAGFFVSKDGDKSGV